MPNRLAASSSPYLQQHADNPVDWWPWCLEAFEEARRRDVPVLLSVGYAACHWCHVMAHESFEDPAAAQIVNEHYVAIKVDREERPDIDAVYMRATTMMTGNGGWPMTVFLDHDARPFHAGTYYPPQDRHGMPSFTRVLLTLDHVWRTDRHRVQAIAVEVAAAVRDGDAAPVIVAAPDVLAALQPPPAVSQLAASFDEVHAGFGSAPKFPPSMVLEFLLRRHARTGDPLALSMVERTCEAMARGGMFDQLGGGFARYSVDDAWVVPHFEKMLYDNALLARVYLHLWRATGSPLGARVARQTCDFLLRDLRTSHGGFASSLDADSDPVLPGQQREGAYYVWTPQQLHDALGGQAEQAAQWLGVTPGGTFEHGTSVLQLPADPPAEQWQQAAQRLLAVRQSRPAPPRDDKVVAAWNGLAVAALAEAGLLLQEPRYLQAARDCASHLLAVHLVDGRLHRVSRDGAVGDAAGVLEDYAGLAEGLLTLYQTTGETQWLDSAGALLATARRIFHDGAGGFYDTAVDAEPLLTRPRDPSDSATPAGWTLLTGALLTHASLTGDADGRSAADDSMAALLQHRTASASPRFFGWGLAVAEAAACGPLEVAVVGAVGGPLHLTAMRGTSPGLVVAVGEQPSQRPGLLARRDRVDGADTAYVCRNFACRLPTTDPAELAEQVRGC